MFIIRCGKVYHNVYDAIVHVNCIFHLLRNCKYIFQYTLHEIMSWNMSHFCLVRLISVEDGYVKVEFSRIALP